MDYENDYSWAMSYLSPGESILWRGSPQRFTPFSPNDVYMIPFSILWAGFAFFWEWTAIRNGPILFRLWGIPFVLVGMYILFGRFIYRRFLLKHSAYVITNQRILRRRHRKVDILQGFSLPPFNIKEHSGGLKSISFGQSAVSQSSFFSNNRGNTFLDTGFCLEYLSDGERAISAINAMRSGITQK